MQRFLWGSWMIAGVLAFGLSSLAANCNSPTTNDDSGVASDASPSDGGKDATSAEGGTVAATCAGVCACLASACPDYPFLPDCVTACQDPTNNPVWDLTCRASQCAAAKTDHDGHCPSASGQTTCN